MYSEISVNPISHCLTDTDSVDFLRMLLVLCLLNVWRKLNHHSSHSII